MPNPVATSVHLVLGPLGRVFFFLLFQFQSNPFGKSAWKGRRVQIGLVLYGCCCCWRAAGWGRSLLGKGGLLDHRPATMHYHSRVSVSGSQQSGAEKRPAKRHIYLPLGRLASIRSDCQLPAQHLFLAANPSNIQVKMPVSNATRRGLNFYPFDSYLA